MTQAQENKVNNSSVKERLKQQAQQQNQAPDQQDQAPAEKQQSGQTIGTLIEKMMPTIQEMLPKQISPERMARLAMTIYKNDKKLQDSDPASFLGAVLQSVQLGLEPNTSLGEAYIIPYYNKKKKKLEASFQIGYKGILKMAYNTGQYQSIYAHEVYPNDEFRYQLGLHKDIIHIPAEVPQGEPIYYYAVYKLQNGGYDFAVWSRQRIMHHAKKFSSALQNGMNTPWKSDFDSMAKKTVLLQALKYAPKSIEMAEAIAHDGTIKKDVTSEPEHIEDVIDIDFEEPEANQNDF